MDLLTPHIQGPLEVLYVEELAGLVLPIKVVAGLDSTRIESQQSAISPGERAVATRRKGTFEPLSCDVHPVGRGTVSRRPTRGQ